MIEVRPVRSGKEKKQFLEFPLELYKGNEYFVPALYNDEKKIFNKNYFYYETARAEYFLAYNGSKVVGRISVLIQDLYNTKHNEKRARFTRFDSINDREVSNALFKAAEAWAAEQGMDTICGPLGFSDLEREGLLIEGFDQHQTFEEQYNYDYYADLIEAYGFVKEVDWYEHRMTLPKDDSFIRLGRVSAWMMKKFNLHIGTAKTNSGYIKKYLNDIFDLLDDTYSGLYGTFPFTESMRKNFADSFKLIINRKYCIVLCDKDEKAVAFGVSIPGIGRAVQKSGGRLTLPCIYKVLKEKYRPTTIDLGLVGVTPRLQNLGINAIMLFELMKVMKKGKIEYFETNLTLESNEKVRAQFVYFEHHQNKVRRSYVKKINKV
ncbi:MAG: N-acetyltransferase [Clostridia bacterium]|nr:N-acetyltransferase [Clostridia bacterium]